MAYSSPGMHASMMNDVVSSTSDGYWAAAACSPARSSAFTAPHSAGSDTLWTPRLKKPTLGLITNGIGSSSTRTASRSSGRTSRKKKSG